MSLSMSLNSALNASLDLPPASSDLAVLLVPSSEDMSTLFLFQPVYEDDVIVGHMKLVEAVSHIGELGMVARTFIDSEDAVERHMRFFLAESKITRTRRYASSTKLSEDIFIALCIDTKRPK